MMDTTFIKEKISTAFSQITLDWPYTRSSGKVREAFVLPDSQRLLVTTDRLSAFDVVLTALPYKGQVLNQLSAYWFKTLSTIVNNHLLDVVDPNVSLVQDCSPLPVEVIVRGYITGSTKTSLWTLYESGNRNIYGYTFPDGLQKNDPLPEPIITPTTKAGPGQHDERLTCDEVVNRGFLDVKTWDAVQQAALAIFKKGQETAAAAGFCLVDTKYEFGLSKDGALMLIDEVHTPDSSRYWHLASLENGTIDQWDKEYVRLWYSGQGYRGDGQPPEIPADVIAEAALRYIHLYEGLTGESFVPRTYPVEPAIIAVLKRYI
ncbi:MAG: phosphoribosylaminoimidazolesuccinocarboxamide synthase [Anaerolineae bacterium]|nr:phosphoribosylaminoimidazolesuccinocarboxamide synthase [Anaerolineae bacterium]